MTLTEYCTGIADAIREKEGSTGAIPAPDHAARIKALSTGGGGGFETAKVTFGNGNYSVTYTNGSGEVITGQPVLSQFEGENFIEVAKNTLFICTPIFGYAVTTGGVVGDLRPHLGGSTDGVSVFYATADGTIMDD